MTVIELPAPAPLETGETLSAEPSPATPVTCEPPAPLAPAPLETGETLSVEPPPAAPAACEPPAPLAPAPPPRLCRRRLFVSALGDWLLPLLAALPVFSVGMVVKHALAVAGRPGGVPAYWFAMLAAHMAMAAVVTYRLRTAGAGSLPLPPQLARPARGWLRDLVLAAVGFHLACRCINLLAPLLHLSVARHIPHDLTSVSSATPALEFFFLGVTLGLVTPIVEEVWFRGLLFGRYLAQGYPITGMIVSTLLFAIGHGGSVVNLARIAVFGACVAWLYYRSRSCWPSIAFHATNNLLFLIGLTL